MVRGICMVAGACLLALSLMACGGSARSASSASPGTSATAAPVSGASFTSATTAASPHSSSTVSTAASSSHAATATAPPPTPPGTPAAPNGLRQTTGYATYELCSARCAGSVPAALRRPLHLPSACGRTAAVNGPISTVGSPDIRLTPFISSAWAGARVTWSASANYAGPVLIRGRQLGGAGAVGFGEGHSPYDELQLLAPGQGIAGSGREWLSFTRLRSPGCYAYQVDGTGFSQVLVFNATR